MAKNVRLADGRIIRVEPREGVVAIGYANTRGRFLSDPLEIPSGELFDVLLVLSEVVPGSPVRSRKQRQTKRPRLERAKALKPDVGVRLKPSVLKRLMEG